MRTFPEYIVQYCNKRLVDYDYRGECSLAVSNHSVQRQRGCIRGLCARVIAGYSRQSLTIVMLTIHLFIIIILTM